MGGIDPWLNYDTFEDDYETCPECFGTGKDNVTLDCQCWHCNGTGRVKKMRKY